MVSNSGSFDQRLVARQHFKMAGRYLVVSVDEENYVVLEFTAKGKREIRVYVFLKKNGYIDENSAK